MYLKERKYYKNLYSRFVNTTASTSQIALKLCGCLQRRVKMRKRAATWSTLGTFCKSAQCDSSTYL